MDVKLPGRQHNRQQVYTEMLLQVCADYPGIGDFRTLKEHQIRFFYDGLRDRLRESTRPGKAR